MMRATSSDPFRSRNQLCWSQKWASPVPLRARQEQELQKRNCGWVVYKLNMPHASHMGGVWEPQIWKVHNIATALLSHHGSLLDDESLCTFFADAESDCKLSSTHSWWPEQRRWSSFTCTMSVTDKETQCCATSTWCLPMSKKRWCHVQYLANEFWNKRKADYLHLLQKRKKWVKARRNMAIDDVVIVKGDSLLRNRWPLACVVQRYPSDNGLVRKESSLSFHGRSIPIVMHLTVIFCIFRLGLACNVVQSL